MINDELLSTMKKADDLLGEYKKMLEPVLAELARQFSMDMFGVPDKATAEFGHYEAGIDTITLRISREEDFHRIAPTEGNKEERNKQYREWIDKKYGWDIPLCRKMTEMGIGRICVTTL